MASTRDRIIALFIANEDTYLSGQAISEQLNISRTAVWKQINILKKDGYQVDAIPNKGYRIISTPDKLSENTLQWGLDTKWLGKTIHHYPTIDSTQTKANALAYEGAPHGTIVVADKQEAGRGRMNRQWFSDNNQGIWLSIILRPSVLPYQAPQFTLLVGTILAEVLTKETDVAVKIKWPNDLFIGNHKVAGILTEMQAEQDTVHHLVVGIGINVNQTRTRFDTSIQTKATSLREATGTIYSRIILIQQILRSFEAEYENFIKQGFNPIKTKWEQQAYKLNEWVTYYTNNQKAEGKIKGIQEDGALLVERIDKQITALYSAEIDW
ncbi:biotin--[acetyl-CoA-carboxylase] ligase [Paraliobacillus ryukyuensis]|uniref:biotin--[acetyl-CoA-carboxylase] ligase n=1 Tax=Paraliobacillus ryukyuensis TaxID=200904 RepID=UPI0009A85AEE|nr:biotin--[acetyl-CoA-carboxylase] ligase [Paraliobacillus ryukyuensis]